ncbi:Tn3 family transposase [Nonomuraea diastatica]|uniref:Tn3 family transposase n=1 Tax=Nonomuraea diastatica TaxID=1848329 RepID=UPI00140A4B81|nr:Tn3 family transposase [Nonomuraea diastatica]
MGTAARCSRHALRRDLHDAQQGAIIRPHLQDQTEQAWCLTILTNAMITWTEAGTTFLLNP